MPEGLRVGVVGVTGAVGQEMLRVLERREFPVAELKPLASKRSAGKRVSFRGEEHSVEVLDRDSFAGLDLALFSAGGSVSKEFAPAAVEAGAVVVDNSSAFRGDPEIPLVVPEVNPEALEDCRRSASGRSGRGSIVANPNCSTIIMVVALAPLHRASPLKRVTVATYQAASGAGAQGMAALVNELAGREVADSPFPHRLAGNLVPRIDSVQDNDYTREEMKMVWETRKILGVEDLPISATCIRVPVARAHSEVIEVETEAPLEIEEIRKLLSEAPGVVLEDDPRRDIYPMPLAYSERDEVGVGRLRRHPDLPTVTSFWLVGDQILKGAALNAVQIAELVFAR